MLINAAAALENLEADHADIKKGIEELLERREVFLDRYRQKPKRRRKRQAHSITSTAVSH